MNYTTFKDTDKGRENLRRNNPETLGPEPKQAPKRSKKRKGDQIRQANEFLRELSKMKCPK